MDALQSFTEYLKGQRLEYSTIKNYRSDSEDFFSWIKTIDPTLLSTDQWYRIDTQIVEEYKKMSLLRSIPSKTINRRLSALRKLFDFAIELRFTLINPAKGVENIDLGSKNTINYSNEEQEREEFLEEFERSLRKSDNTEVTVKNYLSDINQFLIWLQSSNKSYQEALNAVQ